MSQEPIKAATVDESAKKAKLEFNQLVLDASKKVSQLINQESAKDGVFTSQSKDQLEAALKVLEIAYSTR